MSKLIYPIEDETCPLNKNKCTHGFCSCVYFKNRFGCYPCMSYASIYKDQTVQKELEKRKKIHIEWDYKEFIDISRRDNDE